MKTKTIEVTMPKELEQGVFGGLTDEQKQVIITQAKCDSLMSFIMAQCQRSGAPEAVRDTIGNMAADICSLAVSFSMELAGVESQEQANDLLQRGITFSNAARSAAEGAARGH